jgi:hypothetical protein
MSSGWEIDGSDQTIDPSDVNTRIDRLVDLGKAFQDEPDQVSDDEREELAALRALRSEVQRSLAGREAWSSATIVNEYHFTEYARDYAHGISDLDIVDAYVNWDEFAASLKLDHSEVTFDDATFYVR